MVDALDVANIAADAAIISNATARPTHNEIADNVERQRALNLKDNFGTQPESIEQYRSEHGGKGWMTALGAVAGGLVVAAAAVAMFHLTIGIGVALLIGGLAGAAVGSLTMNHQATKVREGYDSYLDNVAKEGREARDRGVAPAQSQEYDNGAGRTTSHVADLQARSHQTGQSHGLS